ncbi:MAG TPA: YMGG-like glycine zipper-containing protein, partial [Burkholderiales bacterium]|nr:YMGG-like glycine zipper-containing protein [Burkholderiales bacterium]
GKSFDQFRADEQECRGQAYAQIGGKNAEQAASDAASRSALIGTAIGAAVGGLFGGAEGAAVGAAFGLASGAVVGSDASYAAGSSLQRRYDHVFTQCMYGKGHKVPVPAGRYSTNGAQPATRTPPPPPPPPGQPPPEAPPDYRAK